MRTSIKYTLLSILSVLVFSIANYAQDGGGDEITSFQPNSWLLSNNVVPPSPEAASLGRYGNTPVNYYSGSPSIGIPIHTVAGKYISASIGLAYDAQSVKVASLPSWVGLGWSLQAGGVITRSAQGFPDLQRNYYDFAYDTTYPWLDMVAGAFRDNIKYNSWFYEVAGQNIDTQPDVYYYNFPGSSGSFVIMPDKTLITKEYTQLEINPLFEYGKLVSFTIIDPTGVEYTFDIVERTVFSTDMELVDPPTIPQTFDFNSSWYLSSISSTDDSEEITFTYQGLSEPFYLERSNEKLNASLTCPGSNATTPNYCGSNIDCSRPAGDGSRETRIYDRKFLQSIELKIGNAVAERVGFTLAELGIASVNPQSSGAQLKDIQVYRRWTNDFEKLLQFSLTHDYSTGRLTLKRLKEEGGTGGVSKPAHEFSYFAGQLPSIRSNSIDHWGYYNGQGNPNSLIPGVNLGGTSFGDGANRKAYFHTEGVLESIQYPTGGKTVYEYEAHTIPTHVDPQVGSTVGGLRIAKIEDFAGGNLALRRTYKYTAEGGGSSGKLLNLLNLYQSSRNDHFAPPGLGCWPTVPPDPKCQTYSCESITVFATSMAPLGAIQGSHVAYSRVEEIQGDDGGNIGRTVYHYENNPIVSGSLWESKNGTLLKTEVFDQSNRPIAETTQNYEYQSYTNCPIEDCLIGHGAKVESALVQNNLASLCELSDLQSEWRALAGTYPDNCQLEKTFKSKFQRRNYEIRQINKRITSTQNIEYFYEGGSGSVTKNTIYEYDDNKTLQPSAIYFTNSDGDVHRTEIEYYYQGTFIKGIPKKITKIIEDSIVGGTNQDFDGVGRPIAFYEILKGGEELQRATIGGYQDGRVSSYTYMDFPTETFQWDSGLMTERKKGNFTWTYDYTEKRQMASFTDIDGQQYSYGYDGLTRLETLSTRRGKVVTDFQYLYGSPNQVITEINFDDAPTQTTIKEFDGLGRPTKVIQNDRIRQVTQYDEYDRVAAQTYLPGSLKYLEYDESPLRRPTKETYPDGHFVETLYGAASGYYQTVAIDEKGEESKSLADLVGRAYQNIDAKGGTTIYTYDIWGDLATITTPATSQYQYTYDNRHRVTSKMVPGSGLVSYTYTDRDELLTTTDANGYTIKNEYDDYGRSMWVYLTSTQDGVSNAPIIETTYLPETDGDLVDITKYRVTMPDGSLGQWINNEFNYDEYSRVNHQAIDHFVGNDNIYTDYNMADWVVKTTRNHEGHQDLDIVDDFSYDDYGRLTDVFQNAGLGDQHISSLTYNNWDMVETNTLGGGLQTLQHTYHIRGWLEQINDPLSTSGQALASCEFPGEGDPFEDSPSTNPYFNETLLRQLLANRFKVDITVLPEDPNECRLKPRCEIPTCSPLELINQIESLELIDQRTAEIICTTVTECEGETPVTVYSTNPEHLTLPFTLIRIRLCDLSERYVLESLLPEVGGNYARVQEVVVNSYSQTFEIVTEAGLEVISLETLLNFICQGEWPALNDYESCIDPDCPQLPTNCTIADLLLENGVIEKIQANASNIVIEELDIPITLYEVETCSGQTFHLLEEELSCIIETPIMVVDSIVLDSLEDPIITGTGIEDQCADLFHLFLSYEPNGNIATKTWQVYGRNPMRYEFEYDPINRLLQADFSEKATSGNATTDNRYGLWGLDYDEDGNINTLSRNGVIGNCPTGLTDYGLIDGLVYNYDPANRNRLLSITDGGDEHGFDAGAGGAGYTYDAMGNMISDSYKGLTIEYNHLNLPRLISKGDERIEIYYDASGRKLRQEFIGAEGAVQDYDNGIDYRDSELQSATHGEGRIFYKEGGPRYEYFLKDHLGNIRLSISDINGNGCIEPNAEEPELLQENHYYPFGLNFDGPWQTPFMQDDNGDLVLDEEGNPKVDQDKLNRYQYNGKELVGDMDLGWNDYGARWYDPVIARFSSVDPLAEDFEFQSPFVYAANDPIKFIDNNGENPVLPLVGAWAKRKLIWEGIKWVGRQVFKESHAPPGPRVAPPGKVVTQDATAVTKVIPEAIIDSEQAQGVVKANDGEDSEGVKEIYIDAEKYPESAKNLEEAIEEGYSNEGVIDRKGAKSRRRKNLKGIKTEKGKDRDEAPPAVIDTGNKSKVKKIPSSDNRGAGASIGNQIRNLPNGTKVRIRPKKKG